MKGWKRSSHILPLLLYDNPSHADWGVTLLAGELPSVQHLMSIIFHLIGTRNIQLIAGCVHCLSRQMGRLPIRLLNVAA